MPIPVLRPVFEFGEENTGNRDAPEGDSPAEAAVEPEPAPEEEPAATPEVLSAVPDGAPDPAAASAAPSDTTAGDLPDAGQAEDDLPELAEAQPLFSQKALDDPLARPAVGNLSPGLPAAHPCTTKT